MIPQFAAAALAGFTSWMHGNFLDRYAGPRKDGDDGVEKPAAAENKPAAAENKTN